MRSLPLAAGLAAAVLISTSAASFATSPKATAAQPSRAKATAVSASESGITPPNCVRESCGRLWCWRMRGETSKK